MIRDGEHSITTVLRQPTTPRSGGIASHGDSGSPNQIRKDVKGIYITVEGWEMPAPRQGISYRWELKHLSTEVL